MRSLIPSAAALTGAALLLGGVGLAPAAHADTTAPVVTQVTQDDVITAIKAARTATLAAEADGWAVGLKDSFLGEVVTGRIVYASSEGRILVKFAFPGITSDSTIAVQHRGAYGSLGSLETFLNPAIVKRAIAVTNHPHATWIYGADPTVDITKGDYSMSDSAPDGVLKDLTDTSQNTIAGDSTKTVAADGTTTYVIPVTVTYGGPATFTVVLGADGTFRSVNEVAHLGDGDTETTTITASYGTQHVEVPAAGTYVSFSSFAGGLTKVMTQDAARIAWKSATTARKRAHGHAVSVKTLRAAVATNAAKRNRAWGGSPLGPKVFTRHAVVDGVKIVGTNPFTGRHASITVRAAGTHTTVRR